MAEQWLSIVEYARTFRVSDMTVRRRIKTGKLHAVLKEGKYFIPIPVDGGRSAMHAAEPEPERAQPAAAPAAAVAYPRRAGEMQVIKGHPAAQSTYAPQQHVAPPQHAGRPEVTPRSYPAPSSQQSVYREEEHDPAVPQSLSRPLGAQDTSLVDTRALLAFCEASLRKLNEGERRTVEKFKSKLEAVEAHLLARDHEIKALRQQVEDLQLLVKILERK